MIQGRHCLRTPTPPHPSPLFFLSSSLAPSRAWVFPRTVTLLKRSERASRAGGSIDLELHRLIISLYLAAQSGQAQGLGPRCTQSKSCLALVSDGIASAQSREKGQGWDEQNEGKHPGGWTRKSFINRRSKSSWDTKFAHQKMPASLWCGVRSGCAACNTFGCNKQSAINFLHVANKTSNLVARRLYK